MFKQITKGSISQFCTYIKLHFCYNFEIILTLIPASTLLTKDKWREGKRLWDSGEDLSLMVCSLLTEKEKKDYTLSSKFPCTGSDFTHWNLQGHYPLFIYGKLHLCVLWECSGLLFTDQCYRVVEKNESRTPEMNVPLSSWNFP